MFVADTNLLLHAANRDSPIHRNTKRLVNSWRQGSEPWYATWPILYEFLRVITHRNVLARPFTFEEAWNFLGGLLVSASFDILIETRRHPEIVRELMAGYPDLSGSIMHDLHTVALMREHGVSEIRTLVKHFDRFTDLHVVNPLAA
ncbi:MAG TPA: PIN domain-containing protein [Woeseiaceae bacterium]|nr:PIN domain-containing protein [Woeseiaceae bacterium]